MKSLRKELSAPTFTAQAADGELVLHVYDVIGQDFFGDGITVQSIQSAIKDAGNIDRVTMRINSPGGDLFEATAIYNVLRGLDKPVTVLVDGLAASAASIVAMAGDKVSMGKGSMMMIHRAMMMAMGNSEDMRKAGDILDTVSDSAADVYVARTGMDKKEVLKMMKNETWLGADECVENKFADNCTEGDEKAMAAIANRFDLSLFNNVPEILNRQGHTKKVDGENLTPDDFIYIGDPEDTSTWHLPWRFSTEEKTVSHLRDALARFSQAGIPPTKKAAAYDKLVKLCKEHGIEVSKESLSAKADAEITDEADPLIGIFQKRIEVMRARY